MEHKYAALLIGVSFLAMMSVAGAAQTVSSTAVVTPAKTSLGVLIQEALKNNPRLRAAQYRADADRARVSLFRNIPDPVLEYEYDKITPAASTMDGGKVRPMETLAVSQSIPFPTKLVLRQRAAKKEAEVLEQQYKATEQAVVKDVKAAYAGLYLNRRKVEYTENTLSLMRQFVEMISRKYAVNKAGQSEVLRAQVEYSRLSNNKILYDKEVRIAQSLLASLLGREDGIFVDSAAVDPVKGLNYKEEDIVALAKQNRPEIRSALAMLGKAQADTSLSRQEFIPDLTLKYKRELPGGKFSRLDDGAWSGMAGINVPLWFGGRQLSGIKEARANAAAAKADYKAAVDAAVFEARSAFAKYEAARDLAAVYETGILPQAESAVATARRAYESGALTFLELIDSLRMLRDLQMEYFTAEAGVQVALADLDQSVGGSLDK
jgi:outer membrane protein TolC